MLKKYKIVAFHAQGTISEYNLDTVGTAKNTNHCK